MRKRHRRFKGQGFRATHYVMTGIRLQRRVVIKGLLPLAVLLPAVCLAAGGGRDLEEERLYFFDADGWECHGAACGGRSGQITADRGGLVGRDNGRGSWFFSAPPKFLRE